MTSGLASSGSGAYRPYSPAIARSREPANLGDILERVLDKGLVIAGDIRVNLLDIELLTIKLRLVIASLETARDVGINWWESDRWYSAEPSNGSGRSELEAENRRLRERVRELESGGGRPSGGRPSSGRPSSGRPSSGRPSSGRSGGENGG
jgi:hypothetical protein